MPIDDGTGITPGTACEACVHLRPMEGMTPCPHGNSQWPDKKTFFVGGDGTPGSPCYDYKTYDDIGIEASSSRMKKTASQMTDSQLNVELYRKVTALKDEERKKLNKYWSYIFPEDYAEDMVTDTVETGPKNKPHKRKRKNERNKFDDGFKAKEK